VYLLPREVCELFADDQQVHKNRKMVPDKIKKKDRPRLLKALGAIAADFPGTAAARDAERAMERVRA